jgi:nucleotide-binding universal stress UspA family protein
MRILIGIDGSPDSATALRAAEHLLQRIDREIDILCVAPSYRRREEQGHEGYVRRILSETNRILEAARRMLPADENFNLLTEVGSPSAVLVDKSEDYDLTVIGPTGYRTNGGAGLGAVASRVVENAPGPVMVAREPRNEDGLRILAAVDGSSASVHALQALCELFDLKSAEISLMYITETPWIQLGLEEDWETYSEEDQEKSESGVFEKELVREGVEIIERARDLLRDSGAAVNTRMSEGNPANEILSEAERGQYDLVVAGATGTRDLKHRMLGSVSAKLAADAPCSVLIVREREELG